MPDSLALAPAPRDVPFSLRLRLLGGGVLPMIGWLVFGLGLIFASVFLRQAEPLFGDPFAGTLSTIDGTVARVEDTNARVNNRRVVAVHFKYAVGGNQLSGLAYTTDAVPEPGATIPVEYVRAQPTTARIRGMRSAMFPAIVWLVALIPAIGAVLVLVGALLGWRQVKLLRDGQLTRGRMIESRPTNTVINSQRVHALTFRFHDATGKERDGTVRTHRLANVTDDAEETLLYDPVGSRIVLWDMLPKRPEIDRDGQFQPLGLTALVPVLLPPTVVAILWSVIGALMNA